MDDERCSYSPAPGFRCTKRAKKHGLCKAHAAREHARILFRTCEECNGVGRKWFSEDGYDRSEECARCHGTGKSF